MSLLKWALILFIISLIAGGLGFSGVSQATSSIARILFFIFIVLFVILLIAGLTVGKAVF